MGTYLIPRSQIPKYVKELLDEGKHVSIEPVPGHDLFMLRSRKPRASTTLTIVAHKPEEAQEKPKTEAPKAEEKAPPTEEKPAEEEEW